MTFQIMNIEDKDIFESACTSTLLGGMIVGQIVGGVLGAECQEEDIQRWKRMAKTFSTQGVGFWIAPLVSWVYILLYGDMAWSIVLGIGCIPGILIIILKCYYGVRRDVVVPKCCTMNCLYCYYVLLFEVLCIELWSNWICLRCQSTSYLLLLYSYKIISYIHLLNLF